MREINRVIIHCSATAPDHYVDANEIRRWHKAKGWSDIGYHYVITRDGIEELGRPIEQQGAHAKGHNEHSVGICLVGGVNENREPDANFTLIQYGVLWALLRRLKVMHPAAEICGHRDIEGVTKSCPCFDVKSFIQYGDL